MSDDFKPGDLVECIKDSPFTIPCVGLTAPSGLTRGALYTIDRLVPSYNLYADGRVEPNLADPSPGVWVCEAPLPQSALAAFGPVVSWNPQTRFRLVYRPDPRLIERLVAEPVFMPPVKPVKVGV